MSDENTNELPPGAATLAKLEKEHNAQYSAYGTGIQEVQAGAPAMGAQAMANAEQAHNEMWSAHGDKMKDISPEAIRAARQSSGSRERG